MPAQSASLPTLARSSLLALSLALSACGAGNDDESMAPGGDADAGTDTGSGGTDADGSDQGDAHSDEHDNGDAPAPVCGDGVIEGSESCDGDALGGETCATQTGQIGDLGCQRDCTFDISDCHDEPTECGDGSLDSGEECDGDDLNATDCENLGFAAGGDLACSDTCQFDTTGCVGPAVCGDGIRAESEQCDDGNLDWGDGCDGYCIDETCGDGIIQPSLGEACDTGNAVTFTCPYPPEFGYGLLTCSASCAWEQVRCPDPASCGDGVLDMAEACDDGNTDDGDGCSSDCRSELCGNGDLDSGEACDGELMGDASCAALALPDGEVTCDDCRVDYAGCHAPFCGDALVDEGEECDDGNESEVPCDARCVLSTECGGAPPEPWWRDADGDGYGDPADEIYACDPEEGYVDDDSDCNDDDAGIHPGSPEHCDGVDENCTDDNERNAVDARPWWRDADGDGFGDPDSRWFFDECTAPDGYVDNSGDCEDGYDGMFPGNPEVCDANDNDCNGDVDDSAVDAPVWWPDEDCDGYGDDAATPWPRCNQPMGRCPWVLVGDDCNDSDAAALPGAAEICDGLDNDCDGEVDGDVPGEGLYCSTGSPGVCDAGETACTGGEVICRGLAMPSPEVCDGEDNDCDGESDEEGGANWYPDSDSDGFGDALALPFVSCDPPAGFVADATDCDDGNPDANPDATEVCDDEDNNCDGMTDEGC